MLLLLLHPGVPLLGRVEWRRRRRKEGAAPAGSGLPTREETLLPLSPPLLARKEKPSPVPPLSADPNLGREWRSYCTSSRQGGGRPSSLPLCPHQADPLLSSPSLPRPERETPGQVRLIRIFFKKIFFCILLLPTSQPAPSLPISGRGGEGVTLPGVPPSPASNPEVSQMHRMLFPPPWELSLSGGPGLTSE